MISRTRPPFLVCAELAAFAAPAPASGDDVVAELTRDTPIAAYAGVVAWSDRDATTARYHLVIR